MTRLALYVLLTLPAAGPAESPFAAEVAPLLQARCLKCHSGKRPKGDLNLASRQGLLAGGAKGPTVVPGKAGDSLLFRMVHDGKMPPREPLRKADVELLRRWIDAGAKWEGPELKAVVSADAGRAGPDWWSLRPIRRPAVPRVKDAGRVRTPIDAFLLARLEEKGLSFAPEADRPTLIRRLTFDLLGLAPTPEEIDDFVSDHRPDAYERLVERLLASPHHGERWGRHWLDVARFAESHGYEMNTLRPAAWPYRDYVIRAFNDDVPFRRFVCEQLAADALGKVDFLTASATGFLVGGPHDMVGNATVEGKLQQRADDLADIVSTTSTTFLGLTVGCARCHDHKFDPVKQADFYALQAVFAGVEHAERAIPTADDPTRREEAEGLRRRLAELDRQLDASEPRVGDGKRPGVNARRNVERFRPVKARHVRFVVTATTDGTEPCIDELELYGPDEPGNLALASRGVKAAASSVFPNNALHRIEHINDGRHGNGRSWISAERGKGWVELVLPRAVVLDRVVWGRDRQEKYRDRLPRAYRIEASEDGVKWAAVASSDDRSAGGVVEAEEVRRLRAEQQRVQSALAALSGPLKAYAGTFRAPDVVYRLHRGDVLQKREIVGPAALSGAGPALALKPGADEPQRRLALAEWVGHADNPLPARVLVNRLWHWHLGQGIVRTPSDLGCNGDRPSHPELLDWLASEFLTQGGRLKPVHRLIVLSSAYRQSSRHDPRAAASDAGNGLLWRSSPRRMEAEAIRDAMLQVSGALDTRMGGPGYHLWEYSGYVIVFSPKAKLGPAEFRRMVYQFKPRLQQDGTFGAFDCPDATAAMPRRNVSTTALQALNLLNDPFVLDQAGRFAARVRGEVGDDVAAQVRRAFRLALGRAPSAVEAAAGEKLARSHGLAHLCRALYNANEFVFVH